MKPLFRIALLLIGMAAPAAQAAITYTFEPESPRTTAVVRLRIDTTECLLPIPGIVRIDASEPSVEVDFHGTDTGCDPGIPANLATPRILEVGTLNAGTYATRIYACGFGPMGETCSLVQLGQLTVTQESGALTIPTLSSWAALAVASLLLIVGVLWRGRS